MEEKKKRWIFLVSLLPAGSEVGVSKERGREKGRNSLYHLKKTKKKNKVEEE